MDGGSGVIPEPSNPALPYRPRLGPRQLTPDLVARASRLHLEQTPVLSAVTAVLSNLVGNVPVVLMMKPLIEACGIRPLPG